MVGCLLLILISIIIHGLLFGLRIFCLSLFSFHETEAASLIANSPARRADFDWMDDGTVHGLPRPGVAMLLTTVGFTSNVPAA